MLLWLLAFILAIAPGAALLWYIRHLDKYEPEPWRTIGIAFLAGSLSVIPAIIIEMILGIATPSGFMGTVYTAFIVASMTEEFCKGGMTYALVWKKPEFNEILDGMVYFGVGHLGFAITENLKYVFIDSGGNVAQGLMNAMVRTTTAVPLHVTVGLIMGYHMGVFRFGADQSKKYWHLFQAFAIPIALHGFYDLAAFNQGLKPKDVTDLLRLGFGSAGLYAAVVALWMVLLPRVRKAQEASPWRPKELPTVPLSDSGCLQCGSAYPVNAQFCHVCGTAVVPAAAAAQQAPAAQ